MKPEVTSGYSLDPAALREFCVFAFRHVGMSEEDADVAASVLIRTDLRGVHTHGVRMLPNYIKRLRAGGINPRATFDVIRESASTALVEGNAGLGHVLAVKAVHLGMQKAEEHDVAVVLVRNSNHFGAAGHYALLCAEAGYIGIVLTNAPTVMKVTGSRGRVLGNGPTAYGFPNAGAPIVLDIAMSTVAGSVVSMAYERREAVPEGWIVDRDGRPSTNPKDFLDGGSLVPIGDHKGYGLTLVGELLAGALSGAAMASAVGGNRLADGRVGKDSAWNVGHAFIVLKVTPFMDLDHFRGRVAALAEEIHNASKVAQVERIYLPGEIESDRERMGLHHGLRLDTVTWETLSALAVQLDGSEILNRAAR